MLQILLKSNDFCGQIVVKPLLASHGASIYAAYKSAYQPIINLLILLCTLVPAEICMQSVIENALRRTFAPEFLNRVDDVVMFNSLEKTDIHKIIDIELHHVFKRVEEMGYRLELTAKAKDFIAEKGWDEQYGARPLKRAIQQYVEDELAEKIITTDMHIGDVISIDLDDEKQEIVINVINIGTKVIEEATV